MKIIASNHFLRFKKKSPKKFQLEIDCRVNEILSNPEIGEEKTGDLKGVRVHKFKSGKQQFLLAYSCSQGTLFLYTIGNHENFYKKLKKYFS